MGKIKVLEVAKLSKLDSSVVIKKLGEFGIHVKNENDLVDDSVVRRLNISSKIETTSAPHIIRRKVKVVTTDDSGNEIERITTKAGSVVHKTSVIHELKVPQGEYSKEGLGVVRSSHSRNAMSNIVVTQNGKKIEPKKEETNEIIEEINELTEIDNTKIKSENIENIKEDKTYVENIEVPKEIKPQYAPRENRPPYVPNQNRGPYVPRENRDQSTPGNRPPYVPNQNRGPYVPRDNNGVPGNRPPYVPNQNRGPYVPRDNNGASGNRPPYVPNQNRGPYVPRNNNGTPGSRPPFNPNRPSYNTNRPGFGTGNNTTVFKVDKFIKEVQSSTDIIQKETRDYSTTLIDKKKYNVDKTSPEAKKATKNVNEIREQNTRIDFNKFKGMQVSQEGLMDLYDRGSINKYGVRRKKIKPVLQTTKIIPITEITLSDSMTVKSFAEAIKKQASDIIKKLFSLGIMANVNQEIDFDTAFLLAGEFGIEAKKAIVVTEEDVLFDETDDDDKNMVIRPPIVTIMGHVDHGKTSLLDKIREANVVAKESGGITQHIGAYKVKINGKAITFLDTPGHEAFTEMRIRGAQVTDIVVIVIAADDSIKPQTIEAIKDAKDAGVSIIVAINKTDKPGANIEKVKQDMLEHELCPEEWGGDTVCVPVSAKTGDGIESLLEMILLVADVKELKANPNKQAKGTVIEAKLDRTRGTLATVLVQRGTLNIGDTIVLGDIVGRVRGMTNDKGEKVKKAGPSTPVEILGLGTVPETGDIFYEVKDEKTANKLISKRKAKHRVDLIKQGNTVTLDDLYSQIKEGEVKNLDIILRADVQGSAEALKDSLEKLSNEEVNVRVIASNTGGLTESDITLAKLSKAIVIGFNIKPDVSIKKLADKENVNIKLYKVIYDAIDDVRIIMKSMFKPIYKEVIYGTAEVRNLFKVSNIGTIAGSYVKSGKILRNAKARLIRADEIIADAKIDSLKREKDDAKEVKEGYECGIKLEKFNDINIGDIFECYDLVEEKRV